MVAAVLRRLGKMLPSILQAVAMVALLHLIGQSLISRFGGSQHRFNKNHGLGADKVQRVIKYIDKNMPRFRPSMKQNINQHKGLNQHKDKQFTTTRATTTTTTTTPAPPPPLDQLEAEQEHRVHILHQACRNMENLTNMNEPAIDLDTFLQQQSIPTKPLWQNLICSKEHKLSYCPTFKSASTFLLKKLLLISPKKTYNRETVKVLDMQANVLARKEFGYLDSWEQYPQFTKDGTTFMFVRHPFERILSAFRDKLEDPAVQGRKFNEYYYNKYGSKIVMNFRKEKITGPSFKFPRFQEFIEFVLSRELRYDDEHWAPNFMACSPCLIPFNFIGHFETLYWDVHLLANKTGFTQIWDNSNDYFQSSTHLEVSRAYYGKVDRDVIRKLYKRYKIDFDLFGYSPEEYINMGKPGPEEIIPVETTQVGDQAGESTAPLGQLDLAINESYHDQKTEVEQQENVQEEGDDQSNEDEEDDEVIEQKLAAESN